MLTNKMNKHLAAFTNLHEINETFIFISTLYLRNHFNVVNEKKKTSKIVLLHFVHCLYNITPSTSVKAALAYIP